MGRTGVSVVALAAMAVGTASVAGAPRVSTVPQHDLAATFGAEPAVSDAALSPDGRQILFIQTDGGEGRSVMVAPVDGSAVPHLVANSAAASQRLISCDWANNARIVCSAYFISAVSGMTLSYTRMLAFDAADGGHAAVLEQHTADPERVIGVSQFGGEVIDWMQGDTGKLLVERDHRGERDIGTHLARTADGLGVDLIDARSGFATKVEDPDQDAVGYLSDGRGTVRMKAVSRLSSGGYVQNKTTWLYRKKGDRRWQTFGIAPDEGPGLNPIAIDPDTDVAYCLDKQDGRDALWRVSLDGSLKRELAFADPRLDVEDAVRVGREPRVVGVSTSSETRNVTYFDRDYAALGAALSKALPKLPIVTFVSASADGTKLLIFAGSDVDPGRYYLYDRTSRKLNELALARPDLEHATLATMTPVTYKAADGTAIPAFLTLPPGGGKGLPAIVMPHGGPAAHDDWGFDWLVQFYAARGYAVLQPEFRGSTGYGDAWRVKNGFKSWRTSISDVNDAGRWLVTQGIADPAKLAIVGWSYGGYAALQSQVLDPGLFKAVVAIAPVTDFDVLRQQFNRFTSAGIEQNYIGSGDNNVAGSPARHADVFKAPVMLFHGTLDQNVAVGESELMNQRLKAAGKKSDLVIYQGLDHSLPSGEIRADMLRRSDAFLRASMGMAG